MNANLSFGPWLKQRRSMLDITQRTLAAQAGCSAETIRKLEAERIRPSRRLAERLTTALALPADTRDAFLQFARGQVSTIPTALHNGIQPPMMRRHTSHTLPYLSTPLLGRASEMMTIRRLLLCPDVRVLTLVGSPGVGKTRLALEAAIESVHAFPGGVCLVDLATLRDTSLVLPAIARALNVHETSDVPLLMLLQCVLQGAPRLVVLDNAEYVRASAPALAELLALVPHLQLLVTSRVPLHLTGEHCVVVAPLALPPCKPHGSIDTLTRFTAVELFVARARAVQHDFTLDEATAQTIAQICTRLDGVPLAIELAAARINVLPPHILLRRLDQQLDLLVAGPVDVASHHRTLRAAIAWSYDLLDREAQTLFRRLSVFAGSWTLSAAEVICNDQDQLLVHHSEENSPVPEYAQSMLDRMTTLVDHHLVALTRDTDDEPRFSMLDTLRTFALEQSQAHSEAEMTQAYHAAYYLQRAEEAEPYLHGSDQRYWLRCLDADLDNFRAAWIWSQTKTQDLTIGFRFIAALAVFWDLRGYLTEGWSCMQWALAQHASIAPTLQALVLARASEFALGRGDHVTTTELATACLNVPVEHRPVLSHAIALATLGMVAHTQNTYDEAQARYEESLDLARVLSDDYQTALVLRRLGTLAEMQDLGVRAKAYMAEALAISRRIGDQLGVVRVLTFLAYTPCYSGDYTRATTLFKESLRLAQEVEDQYGIGAALNGLGEVARLEGADDQAIAWYHESRTIWQQLGKRINMAAVVQNLGHVALHHGDISTAQAAFAESVVIWQQFNNARGMALCVAGFAGIALARGEPEHAVHLLGAAAAALDMLGTTLDVADGTDFDQYRLTARSRLATAPFECAWRVGTE